MQVSTCAFKLTALRFGPPESVVAVDAAAVGVHPRRVIEKLQLHFAALANMDIEERAG